MAVKKTVKKKAAAPAAAAAEKKATTKSEALAFIAEQAGVSKKEVGGVLDALTALVQRDLGKKGPGVFTLPGLLKMKVVRKPATKARKGVNPFTGEEITIKAKPARNAVKVQPLKALKDMV